MSAESRTYKSQKQNKKSAFLKLANLLISKYTVDNEYLINNQVIRTYNQLNDRVTCHLTGLKESYKQVLKNPNRMIETRHTEQRVLRHKP